MKRAAPLLQILIASSLLCFPALPVFALSTVHHLYNFSRQCCRVIAAPIKGALIRGPQAIKAAYVAEVWEQEKPEDQGKFRNKLFGVWRAPGEEAKAIIDGITEGLSVAGDAFKEIISIFWGD